MQLGALPYPLAEVPVVGGQQHHEPARDEQVQPPARGGGAHPRVASQAGEVQHLAGRGADEREERAERLEVADLLHVPQVALEVGLDVALHPQVAVDVGIEARLGPGAAVEPVGEVDLRGAAAGVRAEAVEQLPEAGGGRRPDDLGNREGIEVEHGCPPREGLAHAPHQREVLRAGEQPAARLPAGVDVVLDVVEELRLVLDFVEDDAVAGVREKPDGVVARDVAHVRALERYVPMGGGELLAEEGGLAGLTGSDDEHRGERAHRTPDGGRQRSGDVRHCLSALCQIEGEILYLHR